jgi:uncharacterized protein with PIN domain
VDEAPVARKERRAPSYRVPSDEEVVAAIVKVMLREGQVTSQRRLRDLVQQALRDASYRVGEDRVRSLALRSGLVGVAIHARHDGDTPRLDACPVCGNPLHRTSNRTLAGGNVQTGYKCTRCPWWTGRDYRVPQRYSFFPLVEKRRGKQVTFREGQPMRDGRSG